MHPVSITQAFVLGLLAAAPFGIAAPIDAGTQGLARRYVSGPVGSAAKMIREALPTIEVGWERRDVPPPDEFGSWEDKRDVPPPDEFGSWEKRETGLEARHHTEAQIAAKEAAAAAAAAAKVSSTATSSASTCTATSGYTKRNPHHTEAQIAAKEAAAAAAAGTSSCTE